MEKLLDWNWDELLQIEKDLYYFAEITLPAFLKRGETIPHVAIVCEYPELSEFIVSKLLERMAGNTICEWSTMNISAKELQTMVTSIEEGSVVYVKRGQTLSAAHKDTITGLCQILSKSSIQITLGKGIGSQVVSLDLPGFTFVMCFEQKGQIKKELLKSFEYLIDIDNVTPKQYCQLEIQSIAKETGMSFTKEAMSYIVDRAEEDYKQARRLVKWIRDYTLVNGDCNTDISDEYLKKIL